MNDQKYIVTYVVIANNIDQVKAIAIEIFDRTHIEPTEIQLAIPWDRQQAVKDITQSRSSGS